MQSLSIELKSVIARRLSAANSREVLAIASALCADDEPLKFQAQEVKDETLLRFDVRDDIVCDRETGLMWTRSNVSGGRMEWKEAQDACTNVSLGGFSDWRLPTIKELLSIVDYERHEPAINTDVFTCEPSWYWSSTSFHSSPGDYAWGVYFNGGDAGWNGHGDFGFVRAVRVGQF